MFIAKGRVDLHFFSSAPALVALALAVVTGCGSSPSDVSSDPGSDQSGSAGDDAEGSAGGPVGASTPASSASSSGPAKPPPQPGTSPQTTDLYHAEKGDPTKQAVVFIHGGPGANSMMFELTAQDALASLGYYVVTYDQRGSSRSPQGAAKDYSYDRATQDLDDLIGALHLSSPILLAHSFGGSIALKYLDRYKGRAKAAVLVSSPMNFPQTYDTTLTQCAARYKMMGKSSDAKQVTALHAAMFPNGVQPPFVYTDADIDSVIACQQGAMLYYPLPPTAADIQFELSHGMDTTITAVNSMVGSGYQANDQVGYTDFEPLLAAHKSEVHGIYAPTWDVMFSSAQLATIESNMASYTTVANAGHFIFVDQPKTFVSTAGQVLGAIK